jgi:hypothetical protein
MRTRFLVPILAALLALPVVARADDDEAVTGALSLARSWLSEIDAGNYEQSYNEGGSALHEKVPQDSWVKILKTERPPLGKVARREEVSHVLHTDGLEGVNGTFLVVTYHTNFSSKPDEIEYVVMKHEFGGWRCVGYDFGPANPQPPADGDNQPTTTTTDQTLAPPTPTNGMVVPAQRTSNP